MDKKLTILIFILAIIFCSCIDNSSLKLKGEPIKGAEHIGQGIWIIVPDDYKRAKGFEGFQAKDNKSSISLQVDRASIEQVRKSFDKTRLSKKGVKLLAFRPVKIGDVDSALYSIVEDNRKKTRRYTLSIQKDDLIFSVKGFTFQELASKYESKIERALFSTYFGENENNEEEFTVAKIVTFENIILTRDGKFPTQSDDKASIEIKTLENNSNSKDRTWRLKFLAREMGKFSNIPTSDERSERLTNGTFNSSIIKGGELNLYGALITDQNRKDQLIICQTYSNEALVELEKYVRFTHLKTTIGPR